VVLQAIMKKNYGCTHYIVAERAVKTEKSNLLMEIRHLFEEISMEQLGITPIFMDETFYRQKSERLVNSPISQHDRNLSELLGAENLDMMLPLNQLPPLELCCEEITSLLAHKTERYIPGGIENNNLGGFSELNPRLQQLKLDND
ncbi:hypothetical protein JW964_04820, partial [candidate division KSB1 bacterium]|nr:hypothetical protein [candidate division KSB1 bacterium]